LIEQVDRSGTSPKAIARCDDCGTSQYETCDYTRKSDGTWVPNEGQVIHRLTKQGWAHVKGKLRCMACELKRKAKKDDNMTDNVTPLRQPTAEQKRQIFEMLTVAYDATAGRFRDCESDVTVADALGNGILFGWVAQIREEFFGPDGRNEELDRLKADLARWQSDTDKALGRVHDAMGEVRAGQAKVADLQKRLDALLKAAGPRARSA
jgi:hypothetical protein